MVVLSHTCTVRFVGKGPANRTRESQKELSSHYRLAILEDSFSSRAAVPSNSPRGTSSVISHRRFRRWFWYHAELKRHVPWTSRHLLRPSNLVLASKKHRHYVPRSRCPSTGTLSLSWINNSSWKHARRFLYGENLNVFHVMNLFVSIIPSMMT